MLKFIVKSLPVLIIFTLFSSSIIAKAHNHFPITTESKIMIEKGKIAYQKNCVSCHMVKLVGAENWKEMDVNGHRKAPPLNGTGHTWHHDDQTLHSIIKYGFAKLVKNYQGKMIGFEDNLSDKEIDNVLAYIKSYWSKEEYEYQINLSK
jgi:mono/diheme cytochrome c family protein